MNLEQALKERFGARAVERKANPLHPEQELFFLYLELSVPLTIVMTATLHEYDMPVLPLWKGREHNEIFFCLPAYWDYENPKNENANWIFDWLFRLQNFALERNTWFGPGHTIAAGNPPQPVSPLVRMDHFFFIDPIFTKEVMQPVELNDMTVYFLAVMPIFEEELDYKTVKGTGKTLKKMVARKIDERLDDYRSSFMASRLKFW